MGEGKGGKGGGEGEANLSYLRKRRRKGRGGEMMVVGGWRGRSRGIEQAIGNKRIESEDVSSSSEEGAWWGGVKANR